MQVERKCQNKRCGRTFTARSADVARGWARFCSKSCKAEEQERHTHQNANHHHRGMVAAFEREYGGIACFNRRGEYVGFMDHFSNEEHDCNKSEAPHE